MGSVSRQAALFLAPGKSARGIATRDDVFIEEDAIGLFWVFHCTSDDGEKRICEGCYPDYRGAIKRARFVQNEIKAKLERKNGK